MNTSLSIFVSGSKKLKEHRLRLKALVNNLNGEYRMKGYQLALNMFSYLNLGDNQTDYDDFIENKSDVVIFLVEDGMGEKTKEEFLVASQAQKKKGSPKTYVFLKEYQQKTPQIEEVEKLISENSDSYYIEYSNLEDLEFKVRERLVHEIEDRFQATKAPKKRMTALRIWAILSLMAIGFLLFAFLRHSKQVTLLFIGGGSAVNCLEKYEGVGDVYQYDNSICLAVPTKTAWPIISTEIFTPHSIKGKRNSKLFYPVCLSAMGAEESEFLNMSSKDQFVSKGSVLAVHIGEDNLTLYVKKSYHNSLIDGRDTINVEELANFLRDVSMDQVRIFTTEVGSGTLTYYQNSLSPYDITISKESLGELVDKFTDLTPKSKIRGNETPYIMLGSRYYYAKEVYDEGDCRGICIVDEEHNTIAKPLFLYFAGYCSDGGSSFWIPDEMVEFLYKLDPRFRSVIKNNRISRQNERVIVLLNEYLK